MKGLLKRAEWEQLVCTCLELLCTNNAQSSLPLWWPTVTLTSRPDRILETVSVLLAMLAGRETFCTSGTYDRTALLVFNVGKEGGSLCIVSYKNSRHFMTVGWYYVQAWKRNYIYDGILETSLLTRSSLGGEKWCSWRCWQAGQLFVLQERRAYHWHVQRTLAECLPDNHTSSSRKFFGQPILSFVSGELWSIAVPHLYVELELRHLYIGRVQSLGIGVAGSIQVSAVHLGCEEWAGDLDRRRRATDTGVKVVGVRRKLIDFACLALCLDKHDIRLSRYATRWRSQSRCAQQAQV